ncbi:MAG: tyrosine--tRNA ligase [Gemmatimonadetes bacterium]|nr:tyrosine--tRNA ligase [Gemmatimonadota bacterium]HCK08788.1 tyrosine--tRNA ligase [Candidatus Latescibacterota bacterium]
MDILEELEYRECLFQSTEGVRERLVRGPANIYLGVDPTAASMTIGNLIPVIMLRRLQLAGHHPVALVGGGTGLIGDPSGKDQERQLNPAELVAENTASVRSELGRLLDFDSKTNPASLVSNLDWLGEIKMIEFLRDVGKHFSISYMLAKESVSSRMETGISYTEFSYMIFQAYDFLELFRRNNCDVQIGGSDQWGNITAGIELIRRELGERAYGFTNALLERSDGKKFGKSEEGAIFLSPKLTSPYQFYQWFINVPDADVVKFLKIFTFLERETIEELGTGVETAPDKREGQRVLAEEVTSFVHGLDAAKRAIHISEALFYGNLNELSEQEVEEGFSDVPSFTLKGTEEKGLIDLLVDAGVSSSKRQAREDIKSGALNVNGERQTDLGTTLTPTDTLAGKFVVIRRGKHRYFLIRWDR